MSEPFLIMTYKTETGAIVPTNLQNWAIRTRTEAEQAEIMDAIDQQGKMGTGEFHDVWDKWWAEFSKDPNVTIEME